MPPRHPPCLPTYLRLSTSRSARRLPLRRVAHLVFVEPLRALPMKTLFCSLLLAAACVLGARATDPSPASDPQPKTVNVIGCVRAPHAVPWTADLTITGAILRAGGVPFREPKKVRLFRGADCTLVELSKIRRGEIPDPKLQPGDTIEVPE